MKKFRAILVSLILSISSITGVIAASDVKPVLALTDCDFNGQFYVGGNYASVICHRAGGYDWIRVRATCQDKVFIPNHGWIIRSTYTVNGSWVPFGRTSKVACNNTAHKFTKIWLETE
jgi:hypothetical protein